MFYHCLKLTAALGLCLHPSSGKCLTFAERAKRVERGLPVADSYIGRTKTLEAAAARLNAVQTSVGGAQAAGAVGSEVGSAVMAVGSAVVAQHAVVAMKLQPTVAVKLQPTVALRK